MDFSEIYLSSSEFKILKKSLSENVPLAGAERLVSLRLLNQIYEPIPGLQGTPTNFARITELGKNYLHYAQHHIRASRGQKAHTWITTIIAVIGALKAFETELAGLWAWLRMLLTQ